VYINAYKHTHTNSSILIQKVINKELLIC